MAASSSSSGLHRKYGVFLNFGEDTFGSFVSHLYKALRQKRIDTYIHIEKVRKGDRLSEPLTAIRESRLLLVVFSQNYASSTRCLKELVEILKCNGTNEQIMVPIFYQVDPFDVRNLKGSVAEAFARTEMDESWRSALETAAQFSGWDSRKFEDDADLVKKIVEDVFGKLKPIAPTPSKYDVFINFRGADTRKGFVSHLYKTLCQKSISTYIDNKALRKGDPLSNLLTAARTSKISIIVLSQSYAYSSWCLKELVAIWESDRIKNRILIPIFYLVSPNDILHLQRGSEEAFVQHGSDSNAEVGAVWSRRSALQITPNISGWVSRQGDDEAELIELIVEDISRRLSHISSTSSKDKDLVGMDSHMHEMLLLLYPRPPGEELEDVRVVGIWGGSGLGKTTIARVVYDKIACQFEACCFLANVNKDFMKHGKLHMQTELLSSISKNKVGSSDISKEGFQEMLNKLGQKKVLIVLDDVDTLEQIEALLGGQHSFGGGSRIIIITRDVQVLSRADVLYKPKIFNNEAPEFFSQYAFRRNQPTTNHDDLSRRFIHYAQGLPSKLQVFGSSLRGKPVEKWEQALGEVREILQRESHDLLEQMDRELARQESGLYGYEDIYRALNQNTLKMLGEQSFNDA
ncbi:hypothetical protein C1H46_036223 [Malus baccata]|uniref:TIR domain-containing protein n=1 Tax=Malus baccata TaxID=106549 RepID=A0A540KW41_MALBA|nr:hypothetical protein C1H46_036223 [Malus baccata]